MLQQKNKNNNQPVMTALAAASKVPQKLQKVDCFYFWND